MISKKTSYFKISIFSGIVVLFFFLSNNVTGQEAVSNEKDGAFFALSVANYDSMVNWYAEKLGFNLVTVSENNYRKGALLSKQGFLLEIAHFNDVSSRSNLRDNLESHQIYGIFKFGFLISNIEKFFDKIRNEGIEIFFPIVDADAGYKTFGIKDPEGNIVQFFEKK